MKTKDHGLGLPTGLISPLPDKPSGHLLNFDQIINKIVEVSNKYHSYFGTSYKIWLSEHLTVEPC